MKPLTARPMTTTPDAAEQASFCQQLRETNPFLINRVMEPSQAEVDAPAVHHRQLTQLVDLAQMACGQKCGLGAVLWGEAGTGKSHLLARLARWAEEGSRACFVFLQNLQASPETLPRSLLRATLSILTEGRQDRWHESRLYRFVNAALRAAFRQAGLDAPSLSEAERAYHRWLDSLCAAQPSRAPLIERETIYNVFFRFFASAYYEREGKGDGAEARLAVQWLAGDYLDPEQAQRLQLPPAPRREDGAALESDEQLKRVLVALCQFALLRGQPFILCFDGVDGLEADQVGALARFLHALLDSAPNLLVVTSGVEETLLAWHANRVIQESSWNRIAQFKILPLGRITPNEARQIVEVRLEKFLEPFATTGPVKRLMQTDRLFPLGQPWFDEYLKDRTEVRPRDVISWASEGWVRQQAALREQGDARWLEVWSRSAPSPPPPPLSPPRPREELIDRKVADKIAEHVADRQAHPERLPPDADNLAGLTFHLLRQCLTESGANSLTRVERPAPSRRGQKPLPRLVVGHRTGTPAEEVASGVLILATGNATSSAAWALRRVLEESQPTQRFVLVTDERRPLRLGPKGEEYLEQLRRRYGAHFREHVLSFPQYAELDALQMTVVMARSGDLEIEAGPGQPRRVSEREVIASHHRCQRYASQSLLKELLSAPAGSRQPETTGSPGPTNRTGSGSDQEIRQVIAGRLALTPGLSSRELACYYVDYVKQVRKELLDVAECQPRLEAVARALAAEGIVKVSPLEDGLYLLLLKR